MITFVRSVTTARRILSLPSDDQIINTLNAKNPVRKTGFFVKIPVHLKIIISAVQTMPITSIAARPVLLGFFT